MNSSRTRYPIAITWTDSLGVVRTKRFSPSIKDVELWNLGIESIDLLPLQRCTKLTKLSLRKNRIKSIDLAPLQLLTNLKVIALDSNLLTHVDLAPLERCVNLEEIDLSFNIIEGLDLAPLRACERIKRLLLMKCPIDTLDVSPLLTCSRLEILEVPETTALVVQGKGVMNENSSDMIRKMIAEGRIKLTNGNIVENSKYEVALSFAGSQRNYARQVAAALERQGVSIFFDEFEEARMWGQDLNEFLQMVYERGCKYCVLFISRDYVKKSYPVLEKRSALADADKLMQGRILPVRFDDTRVAGLPSSMKYVRAEDYTPEKLAALIVAKAKLDSKPTLE